jgi:hypothetical protein
MICYLNRVTISPAVAGGGAGLTGTQPEAAIVIIHPARHKGASGNAGSQIHLATPDNSAIDNLATSDNSDMNNLATSDNSAIDNLATPDNSAIDNLNL